MKTQISILILSLLAFTGCSSSSVAQGDTYRSEAQDASTNQINMVNATPIPQLTQSLERENVAKRAVLFNDQNKVSYIYLTSFGRVMAFYTVKGKVSSLRSYMTPIEKLVNGYGSPCKAYVDPCYPVEAPDIDGTYGENVSGIFFFTTDGAYVEWNGEYMMSDFPLKLSTQPELVREIK